MDLTKLKIGVALLLSLILIEITGLVRVYMLNHTQFDTVTSSGFIMGLT